MNKLNSDITKSIKQIRTEASDKIKKLIKQKNVFLIDVLDWNKPNDNDFKKYGADSKLYVESLHNYMCMKIGTYEIDNLFMVPNHYEFVTKEEFKNFEKNVYPKLYNEWSAEQKQKATEKRAANAKDAGKLRAKIAKLQAKLDAIEAQ